MGRNRLNGKKAQIGEAWKPGGIALIFCSMTNDLDFPALTVDHDLRLSYPVPSL
jgi:hypothetical protein